jgi:hypothetical protein
MSKLTQFLQKAGLVESDEPTFELPVDPTPTLPPDPPAPAADVAPRIAERSSSSGPAKFVIDGGDDVSTAPSQVTSDYVIPEGVSIDSIFQQANVPPSSFPIERLQKLIDGLKQLDPATQKAAVLAMDAADEAWTIEGVLKDAQAKTDALHAYSDQVTAKVTQIQQAIERDVASLSSAKESAVADIQAQIADLQRKLEATTTQHATDVSGLGAKKQSAQQAGERERQRVTEVISKINNLVHPFLSPASNR